MREAGVPAHVAVPRGTTGGDVVDSLARRPLLVIGGRQRADRGLRDLSERWYGYGSGVVLQVDDTGVGVVHEYVSRPGTCAEDDAVLFKSATRRGDLLYCCTQTEVIVYRVDGSAGTAGEGGTPSLHEVAHVSLPLFNDVHHVVPTSSGTLLVAVSGMELVVEIDHAGNVLQEWDVLGEDTWSRLDPSVDYRMGVDLKPHRAHPNHLVVVGDEVFVTRFEMRDVISLSDPTRRIAPGGERLHDGVLHDGRLHVTSVDGSVIIVDADTLRIERQVRLRPLDGGESILGWCRGLLVDGDSIWVGFSRIRPTNLRQTVSWIRNKGVSQAPTRIARYRLSDGVCDAEIDLEPAGLNAVFSVVPA